MAQQSYSWVYIRRKLFIQKVTCIPVFTAALFTKARRWKQPNSPSTEDWIKVWRAHAHTHVYKGVLLGL